ncbi:ScyD/ScyE family protein [Gramella sp. GC03-9]|uniref:ScyD/ScyE family protein n=1 Tax=Christiangramia oceanisediminis TaxID=2920386 RepID=A0A9X2KZ19_9FLAO|nr:ScyD/ScyE family protein [Gramella oceanisediminis]MCP9200849.1 ScyD/ScyE family protein [Gramella oceanisediminis]
MKTNFLFGLIALGLLFSSGCTGDKIEPEPVTNYDAEMKVEPKFMKTQNHGFPAPLFDLATAPNNDILIADIGRGILNITGEVEISLPGVTSIDPIGRNSLWAVTSASESSETEKDSGQGLYRVSKGKSRKLTNLFAFEAMYNPDNDDVNSNPYSVASLGGEAALVIDAGANDLLKIDNQGNIEVVAIFPPELVSTANIKSLAGCPGSGAMPCNLPPAIPTQAVPTSVVVGPDGYFYVGELKGFPGPTGESNIWKVSPTASGALCGSSADCVKAFDGGFTSIVDMTFGPDGRLYVVELDEKSWAAVEVLGIITGGTIKACDTNTLECETIASGIPLITAITFDNDGNLWATKNALIPDLAEVVKIQ